MGYKQKECPACGVKHNKRGQFCSRSCGNSRAMPDYQKESMAATKREWHATSDTAAVSAYNFTSKGANKPSEPPPVPSRLPLDSNQFVADGDLWTNCD